MLIEVSFFCFNEICNMFLSKLQPSYCYTQLCNDSKAFVFKLISNHLNILVGCNLRFTRILP